MSETAGHDRPDDPDIMSETREGFIVTMAELTESTCWRRLAGATVGRVALTHDGDPIAVPVNCAVHAGRPVFRTVRGGLLHRAAGTMVALEIDGVEPPAESGWSVLVRGELQEITEPDELGRMTELALDPWAPGDRDRWMQIIPATITGRSISRRRTDSGHRPYMLPD